MLATVVLLIATAQPLFLCLDHWNPELQLPVLSSNRRVLAPVFDGVIVINQIPIPDILTEEMKEVIPFESGVSKFSHPVSGFQMKHCRF